MNTPGVPCIFDPLGRAGICGDWLTGSSIEAAILSGTSLANHVRMSCTIFQNILQHIFIVNEKLTNSVAD
jgi:hypothetical protein